ncbi:MAG: T9SS type A sorting domain-containing protein [Ignavibacteria bacterium]|nr:T9SS type A sorting domain-containing protein [Ignavibacteria bacterium]
MNIKYVIFFISITQTVISQYPNFRIHPSSSAQIEPFIVRHPLNQQILFASAYTIFLNFRSEGIYVSTDGGNSWRGTDTCNGAPVNGGHGGDPGPVIDKNGIFILTHQGGVVQGMFSNYSTNQGLNWSNNYPILTGDQDKGFPGTDDAPLSSFYGRTYLVWTRFAAPFPIVVSYTTNSGISWSSVTQINNSFGSNRSFGPALSVGPDGTVYTVWASAQPNSPFTEDCIGFAKSTNGGNNWIVNECAIDCNGIRTTQLSPWTIRANSFPVIDIDKTGGARNGWIYIATTNKNLPPAGSDPDIVFHRSTDGGNSWSSGIRVNQDPLNNGRNQFFPAIRVDEGGGVNIIYFDSRNQADSVDVYLSRSTDGGNSWTDFRITSQRFKPTPVAGAGGAGNMGDNLGLTSGNGRLYPVWMGNYTGLFQTWSAIIDYNSIGISQIASQIPIHTKLHQNYPNPFNALTKIRLEINKTAYALIKIYNIHGQEIKTLFEKELSPGIYETEFNGDDLAGGVYFYRLITSEYSESRKMILAK